MATLYSEYTGPMTLLYSKHTGIGHLHSEHTGPMVLLSSVHTSPMTLLYSEHTVSVAL